MKKYVGILVMFWLLSLCTGGAEGFSIWTQTNKSEFDLDTISQLQTSSNLGSVLLAYNEFTSDGNTIFLAHYNTSVTPNVASGTSTPELSLAPITTGENGYMDEGVNFGIVGQQLRYKGNDGNFNSNSGTVEFWFKPNWSSTSDNTNATDNQRYHQIFDYGVEETNNSLRIVIDDFWNEWKVGWKDNVAASGATSADTLSFSEGVWYYITLEYNNFNSGTNNASVKLYKNGTEVAQALNQTVPFGTHVSLYIGGSDPTRGANGIIDELRISNNVRYATNFTPPARYTSTSGILTSPVINTNYDSLVNKIKLSWNDTKPTGTDILYDYSIDGGTTWTNVPSAQKDTWLNVNISKNKLKVRARFTGTTTASPELLDWSIEYDSKPTTPSKKIQSGIELRAFDKLEWLVSDPDGDNLRYTVIIADNEDLSNLVSTTTGITETSIRIAELSNKKGLEIGKKYYWGVKAIEVNTPNLESEIEKGYFICKSTGDVFSATDDPKTKIIITDIGKELEVKIESVNIVEKGVVKAYTISAKEKGTGKEIRSFGKEIEVVIHLDIVGGYVPNTNQEVTINNVSEKLGIGYYDGIRYNRLTSKVEVDATDVYVSAKTMHLSRYGVIIKSEGIKASVTPNPFTPKASQYNITTFTFENVDSENVEIRIWDPTGRLVRTLTGYGVSSMSWDGRDEYGEYVEGGVYIYQIKIGNNRVAKGTLVVAY